MFGKKRTGKNNLAVISLGLALLMVALSAISGVAGWATPVYADESVDEAGDSTVGVIQRFAGKDRYETAFAIADYLRSEGSDGLFNGVTVAYGGNFPDALSAGYLATEDSNCPILLINPEKETQVLEYIKKNAEKNANVYIVGGKSVVSERFEKSVKAAGFNNVVRLAGKDRYGTNMAILSHLHPAPTGSGEYIGIPLPQHLLIATGKNYPDALSASAVFQSPLMLVGDKLNAEQLDWIKKVGIKEFDIVGGTSAVSQVVEDELWKLGTVRRLAGANRWETSIKVAEEFFGSRTAILATGHNFPDALAAAPLADYMLSPIILVGENNWQHVEKYVEHNRFSNATIVGGTSVISDELVKKILENWNSFTPVHYRASLVNNFSVELLKYSERQNSEEGTLGNTLLSPISAIYAMKMAENGAEGNTLTEIHNVLNGEDNVSSASGDLGGYLEEIAAYIDRTISPPVPDTEEEGDGIIESYSGSNNKKVGAPQLSIANSMWIKDDPNLEVNEEFIEINEREYQAGVYKTAFDEAARQRINSWIEEHTGGTIKDMLSELSEDSITLLINALAFEADWREPFRKHSVDENATFHGTNGETKVPLMSSMEYDYLVDDHATGFIKHYEGTNFAFAALLPDKGVDIDAYVQSLTGDKLSRILANSIGHDVLIKLPKFEVESSMSLSDTLKAMGIKDAFDPIRADFSELGKYNVPGFNICVGDVLQNTYIKVDEKGTKAGAATVVVVDVASAPIDQKPPFEVYLDRPFVYMLIDTNEHMPLFIGVIRNLG